MFECEQGTCVGSRQHFLVNLYAGKHMVVYVYCVIFYDIQFTGIKSQDIFCQGCAFLGPYV